MRIIGWLLLFLFCLGITVFAEGQDEAVTAVDAESMKKQIVSVLTGLGHPPSGYARTSENFVIPATIYKSDTGYAPAQPSGSFAFGRKLVAAGPIHVEISFNLNEAVRIDSNRVIIEKPGILALLVAEDGDMGKIRIFFDPVTLQNTKEKSYIDFTAGTMGNKLAVKNITVTIAGPTLAIRKWTKQIQAHNVLPLISK